MDGPFKVSAFDLSAVLAVAIKFKTSPCRLESLPLGKSVFFFLYLSFSLMFSSRLLPKVCIFQLIEEMLLSRGVICDITNSLDAIV